MKLFLFAVVLSTFCFSASIYTQSLSVDDVIQKNIEARGGAKEWAAVKTIKMTGIYRSFSEPAPFILWRKRPDLYRFDHSRLKMECKLVYDGHNAWWVFPLLGPEHAKPVVTPPPHDKVTLREKEFEPVFWNYQQKGNMVELLGREDLDGEDHYKLKVTLADSSEEYWYLHAETFLDTKMEGTTHDFGQKVAIEAYFDDYRQAGGILLPIEIQQEYFIRYRLYKIENVEINPLIDDKIFAMPVGEGDSGK